MRMSFRKREKERKVSAPKNSKMSEKREEQERYPKSVRVSYTLSVQGERERGKIGEKAVKKGIKCFNCDPLPYSSSSLKRRFLCFVAVAKCEVSQEGLLLLLLLLASCFSDD